MHDNDYGSHTEVDAGRWATAYADESDRYADYEPEAEETDRRTAPPRTLADEVKAAIVWSGATHNWRKDVRETAPRVVAFRLDERDDTAKLVEWFGYEGLQSKIVVHAGEPFMYVRKGPRVSRPDPWAVTVAGNGLDPWFAQDTADKAAERVTPRSA
jgi:hypothetical protein